MTSVSNVKTNIYIAPNQEKVTKSDSKPIAADYLTSNKLSVKDKVQLSLKGTAAGGAAGAATAIIPSAGVMFVSAGVNDMKMVKVSLVALASSVASGVAVGALSGFVKTEKQAAILGAVVGGSVGAAAGAVKGNVSGAVVSGIIGMASGSMSGVLASNIHSDFKIGKK